MIDRGIIKWQPFDSCFNSKEIISDIKREKDKINLPILSEDQIIFLNEKILNAYNLKNNVHIEYYYDGDIKILDGKINYLNIRKKELFINNIKIYFNQILKIEN